MFQYQLDLQLSNGCITNGIATNLVTSDNREFIILVSKRNDGRNNGTNKFVALDEVHKMAVLTPDAIFTEVVA